MLLICLSFPLQDYEHLKGKDWDLLHFLLWHLVEIQKNRWTLFYDYCYEYSSYLLFIVLLQAI